MGSSTEKEEMTSIVKAIDDQLEKKEFSLEVQRYILISYVGNENT